MKIPLDPDVTERYMLRMWEAENVQYTIQKLAKLAGVSSRTLRYYDEIGLLTPERTSSGYRIYRQEQVDRLQQILFYRELGFDLDRIRTALDAPEFNSLDALRSHRTRLMKEKQRIDALVRCVEDSIDAEERGIPLQDAKKFEGFKQKLIAENEQQYGEEIRERYGEEAVEAANEKIAGMSSCDYAAMKQLESRILDALDEAFRNGNPADELGRQVAELHKEWLAYTWTSYSEEAHAGLVQMYVDDPRFAAYYDRGEPGKARFLRDAVFFHLGRELPEPSAILE